MFIENSEPEMPNLSPISIKSDQKKVINQTYQKPVEKKQSFKPREPAQRRLHQQLQAAFKDNKFDQPNFGTIHKESETSSSGDEDLKGGIPEPETPLRKKDGPYELP